MKALAIVVVLVASSTASAGDDRVARSAGQKLFDEGQALYKAGDYRGAADKFQLAYDRDPDPVYLFNAAQAFRFAKECRASADSYQHFLDAAPNAPNRDKVQQYIAEMDACARTQTLAEPVPVEPTPAAEPPKPPPEPPRREVTAEVHAPPPPHHRHRALSYVLGATGVVALGAGAYFTVDVLDVKDQQSKCANTCDGGRIASLDDRGSRDNIGELVSYSLAAAALGASAWLYFRHDDVEAPIAVSLTKGGATVTAGLHF